MESWILSLSMSREAERRIRSHSQGTPFRHERMVEGRTAWTDEETRRNFAAVEGVVG